ncbi:beta-phosphoglucomutase [Weissella halotolerans]|uniref:Beta-phosphoglucomutase n=1 Tax=Weissella halotolerans DSM 20190 TaxID=1123500 RepID=A0A0R2G1Y3_9LACO|nr:beta-phosphoglucomutase [Weissella halotolerans]KRN33478.1 beta-phosphoglucomutase [Weissella halotolerans DSM 20190]
MNQFNQIKGFAFDLDGVVTDTARFHSQAWHALADQVGTPWTEELAQQLKGISRMDSLEMILAAGHHQDDYTQTEKEALAEQKNVAYQDLIKTLTPADILPGMADFIKSLQAAGYRLAVASASKNAPFILEQLKLRDYFDFIVDPSLLAHGKPDPEIFERAAQGIDLPVSAVLALEDSVAGIQAINAAGEISLGIGDGLDQAQLCFPDTQAVTLAAIKAALS